MRNRILWWVTAVFLCAGKLRAAEAWAEANLPLQSDVELWLDGTRQREAYRTKGMRALFEGSYMPVFFDASGNQHHVRQLAREAMPRFGMVGSIGLARFDGKDDFMAGSFAGLKFTNLTVFIVGTVKTNSGVFRSFLSAAQPGQNDFQTGINLDLGPGPSLLFNSFNVEGAGNAGIVNLLKDPVRFGTQQVLALVVGDRDTTLFVNGKTHGSRERTPSTLEAEEFLLGARHYSPSADSPAASGFFGGDLAEVLIYRRALTEAERKQVEEHLAKKYAQLFAANELVEGGFNPLQPVVSPPAVQFFLPGVQSRELPVKLPNINCVKYRPDGKLVALGYNGNIYLLSDSNGDGLEDKVEPFWETNSLRAPIGMALTPPGYAHGEGAIVAAKGKVSMILDTDRDGRADKELIIAQGWKEISHGVDALGVAMDKDGAVYFGLGVADFTNPYLLDKATGKSRTDLKSERGTILRISPDLKSREIVCTGIRFPVALAFNGQGDLFCTDQEGATWLPNGNPLDELLQILPGRHYGFPPRHPTYLPNVVDEPSVFDYGPQHQSLCGLNFNPVGGAKTFGPAAWEGDAILTGYSRGKLYRTKLVKGATGYVAESQLIASLNMLTVDACVSPAGNLTVATHSGQPDWGSGPNGEGKLYQIRYAEPVPQPTRVWASSPTETRVAFDRPLSAEQARRLVKDASIIAGRYVSAGERYETLRPGYQVVQDQLAAERSRLPVLSTQVSPDRRTLILETARRAQAVNYAVTLGSFAAETSVKAAETNKVDLAHSLAGIEATWSEGSSAARVLWLPHFDLEVSRRLTGGSVEHDAFWRGLSTAGKLVLRAQLDLAQMLRPAVQPGAKLDYQLPEEEVTLSFVASRPFALGTPSGSVTAQETAGKGFGASFKTRVAGDQLLPLEVTLGEGTQPPNLSVTWSTAEDARPRTLPLYRMLLPWATREAAKEAETPKLPPEVAGANWLRGRRIFFGDKAACSTCHRLRGEGNLVGPDLSNLIHRDYASVLKDLVSPNATINPDHVSYEIALKNGDTLSGVLRRETPELVTLAQPGGKELKLKRDQIASMTASTLSLMPEGLQEALGPEGLRDLMKFLLQSPLEPAALKNESPILRTAAEIPPLDPPPKTAPKPLRVLLVSGPKDHGPEEHDYPLWQERWAKLLALGENVKVATANGFPSVELLNQTDVAVFYSNNPGWSAAKAPELKAFQERGGGLVYIHFAVDGHDAVPELSDRIGLAWRTGHAKFRHGSLDLNLDPAHPVSRGLSKVSFYDESYWQLDGALAAIQVLAKGVEDDKPQPLMWTRESGRGRVFVSIPGHFSWTFDDPLFRLLLLRGIAWTAHEPADRLAELATIGARIKSGE